MGVWIDGEKLDDCPECGKNLSQREYDRQYCERCASQRALGKVFQKHEYKFLKRDDGFCRVYYKRKRPSGGWSLWCLQWDGEYQGVNLYFCSQDGEPDTEVGAFPMRSAFDKWVWPSGSEPK